VPATAAPPVTDSVKVEVVIVDAFIASLKVADTGLPASTPVAPFAGMVVETTGAGIGAVVNDQVKFAVSEVPAVLCTAVVIVAVYVVLYASGPLGAKVAVKLAAL